MCVWRAVNSVQRSMGVLVRIQVHLQVQVAVCCLPKMKIERFKQEKSNLDVIFQNFFSQAISPNVVFLGRVDTIYFCKREMRNNI